MSTRRKLVRETINAIDMGDALSVIREGINLYRASQEEQTKRVEIWSKRSVLITALNNEKEAILSYFELRFAERRGALEKFYELLNEAVDSGDETQLQTALAGILGVVQENPLKDFAEFKKNMADPDFRLEL